MAGPRKLTPEQVREIRKAHGLTLALVDWERDILGADYDALSGMNIGDK